jgi:hypothetical protein
MQPSNTHKFSCPIRHTQYLSLLTDTFSSSFRLCLLCNRYIETLKGNVSEAVSVPVFRQEAPSLLGPLDQATLSR